MEFISFHCPKCKQPLKIPADKAGRKAKCNKCGNPLTIPFESETVAVKEAAPAATSRKPFDDEDDTGPATYGMVDVPAPPAPPAKKKKEDDDEDDDDDDEEPEKKKEEVLPRRRRNTRGLRRAPLNPEQWGKVRIGMVLVAVSVVLGIAGVVAIRGVVLAGHLARPTYAQIADQVFPANIRPVAPGPGQPPDVDLAKFFAGLMMGSNRADTARLLFIVAAALLVAQCLLAIVGYIFYMQVPPRFGTRGLAIALTALALVNMILAIVFRLLPAAGVLSYVLVPVYALELPMVGGNIARLEPLHILWMHIPMLEMFFGMLIVFLAGFEAVLGCAFIRAVGKSLRDDGTDARGVGLLKLGMGTQFFFVFYQMSGLAGTSEVLVMTLRIIYWLGTCFLLGFLTWYTTVLFQARTMIAKKLNEK